MVQCSLNGENKRWAGKGTDVRAIGRLRVLTGEGFLTRTLLPGEPRLDCRRAGLFNFIFQNQFAE